MKATHHRGDQCPVVSFIALGIASRNESGSTRWGWVDTHTTTHAHAHTHAHTYTLMHSHTRTSYVSQEGGPRAGWSGGCRCSYGGRSGRGRLGCCWSCCCARYGGGRWPRRRGRCGSFRGNWSGSPSRSGFCARNRRGNRHAAARGGCGGQHRHKLHRLHPNWHSHRNSLATIHTGQVVEWRKPHAGAIANQPPARILNTQKQIR